MKICRVPADSRRNLEAEIAKNEEALAKATAIREKELAEFNAEEKDMLQSIGALKSAIVVLSKHHSSFAQVTCSCAMTHHMTAHLGSITKFVSNVFTSPQTPSD